MDEPVQRPPLNDSKSVVAPEMDGLRVPTGGSRRFQILMIDPSLGSRTVNIFWRIFHANAITGRSVKWAKKVATYWCATNSPILHLLLHFIGISWAIFVKLFMPRLI